MTPVSVEPIIAVIQGQLDGLREDVREIREESREDHRAVTAKLAATNAEVSALGDRITDEANALRASVDQLLADDATTAAVTTAIEQHEQALKRGIRWAVGAVLAGVPIVLEFLSRFS